MNEIDALLRDLKKYGTAGRDCALSAEDALDIVAALEAAREDGERLDYVMRHVRSSELRRIGIRTNGGDHRPAIDQARGKGVE